MTQQGIVLHLTLLNPQISLEIDAAGENLIMGSTTGGLWFSGDQGESWEAVSMNLPPVFCLGFG